jgi:hypothetical protein
VALHDRFKTLGWIAPVSKGGDVYEVTTLGAKAYESLGIDVEETQAKRRRFAYACLDWSERRPHLGGALAAAVLNAALKREWVIQDLDSRALEVTNRGRREMKNRLDLSL